MPSRIAFAFSQDFLLSSVSNWTTPPHGFHGFKHYLHLSFCCLSHQHFHQVLWNYWLQIALLSFNYFVCLDFIILHVSKQWHNFAVVCLFSATSYCKWYYFFFEPFSQEENSFSELSRANCCFFFMYQPLYLDLIALYFGLMCYSMSIFTMLTSCLLLFKPSNFYMRIFFKLIFVSGVIFWLTTSFHLLDKIINYERSDNLIKISG